jgi:hypothetical protein
MTLLEMAAESVGPDEFEPAPFEAAVADNLRKGAFSLLVVVDGINEELKGIVEYLNTHSTKEVSVLALEMRRYHEGDEEDEDRIEILLPVLYGEESASPKVSRHAWTKEEFERFLEEHSPSGVQAFRELVRRAEDLGCRFAPSPTVGTTVKWVLSVAGRDVPVFGAYSEQAIEPRVVVQFTAMTSAGVSTAKMEEVADALRAIPQMRAKLLDLSQKDYKKNPTVLVKDLPKPGVVDALVHALRVAVATEEPSHRG